LPTYSFLNTETNEEFEIVLKISEYDQYKSDNPHLHRTFKYVPSLSYNDAKKPDEGFRDILRDIKKGSGKGSNINTF
jgi:hypothetical protein